MRKIFFLLGSLITLACVVSCTSIKTGIPVTIPPTEILSDTKESQSTLTATLPPQSVTLKPSYTAIPSPTKRAAQTAVLTPTQTAEPSPHWNPALNRINNNEGYRGQWASTSNDFIYLKNSEDKTATLSKVSSPKFEPAVLLPDHLIDATLNTDFTWSPDDKTVLFACHPEGHSVTVCIMNSDGSNARMLNPEIKGMNYVFLDGWRDQKNLVFGLYSGGGHVNVYSVNIETGALNPGRAFIHGFTYPSHNIYTPVTSDMSTFDSRLMVISDKFTARKLAEDPWLGGNVIRLPEYRSIPRMQTVNTFEDWLPNSNQMLVFWGLFDPRNTEPPEKENELLLWDVERNTLRLIAPGDGGKFSPDGKLLAYLTYGPAKLDSNSRPAAGKRPPFGTSTSYMQLLNMDSKKVALSIPIIDAPGGDYITQPWHGKPFAQFSPDGRYLAFLTPGEVISDSNGWPVDVHLGAASLDAINLLDLQEKKIVWSTTSNKEAEISWSPTSNFLAYQDQKLEWYVFNLAEMKSTPITFGNGDKADEIAWSFDGSYFSLESCETTKDNRCLNSIKIFDVRQVK